MKEGFCKQRVYPNERWGAFNPHQCNKKIWKDGFCKIHHPDSVEERNRKATERWNAKNEASDFHQLKLARKRIEELEEEIRKLKEAQ
jgi:hypothetical protein